MLSDRARPFAHGRRVNPPARWEWRCPDAHADLCWSSPSTVRCRSCRHTYSTDAIVSARDGVDLATRFDAPAQPGLRPSTPG